jgi:hypothetical protein
MFAIIKTGTFVLFLEEINRGYELS